jgi:hypothetical protein
VLLDGLKWLTLVAFQRFFGNGLPMSWLHGIVITDESSLFSCSGQYFFNQFAVYYQAPTAVQPVVQGGPRKLAWRKMGG